MGDDGSNSRSSGEFVDGGGTYFILGVTHDQVVLVFFVVAVFFLFLVVEVVFLFDFDCGRGASWT